MIHWLMHTAIEVPVADDWLAPGEVGRVAALRIPKRRGDWRLGRWTAKRAVAAYFNRGPTSEELARIDIRAGASGAPEVFLDGQPAALVLSLSHSAGRALCAIAPIGVALGCDLEIVEPRTAGFIADYFTSEECEALARAPVQQRNQLATLLWSAKESALKALREGLRLDTRSVVVTLNEEATLANWHALSVCHTGTGAVFGGWWRDDAGCVLTIVAAPLPAPPLPLV